MLEFFPASQMLIKLNKHSGQGFSRLVPAGSKHPFKQLGTHLMCEQIEPGIMSPIGKSDIGLFEPGI